MMIYSNGYDIRTFQILCRIFSNVSPKMQSNSTPGSLVDVIMFTGRDVGVKRREPSNTWRSFLPGFSSMCCGVVNIFGKYRAIQFGKGITKQFRSSLFIVTCTWSRFRTLDRWLPLCRCSSAFSLVVSAMNFDGAPIVMTRLYRSSSSGSTRSRSHSIRLLMSRYSAV